jgi:predicted Zn-dependent peptidase
MKKIYIIITTLTIIFSFNLAVAGEKVKLNNNSAVITNNIPESDVIALTVFLKGGLFAETKKNNGIGTLFSDVWLKSSDLMNKVEFYGGNIDAGVSNDFFEFEISMLKEDFTKILPHLKKLFNDPDLNSDIFAREKGLLIKEIISLEDHPNRVAMQKFGEVTYGNFPYGLSTLGDKDAVESLTLDDLKAYYRNNFAGGNAVVSLAGNYTEVVKSKVTNIFNNLPEKPNNKIDCTGSGISNEIYKEETYPRIKQSKLYTAYEAPGASSDDYLATKVLSEIMGGGMSSYYFNILRQEKGYAYAVGAFYPSRICSSRFVSFIGLDYSNVKNAIDDIKDINKNATKMISDDDVEKAKNYMLGRILTESQSTQKRSWYAAFFENLGLGYDYFDQYIENLKKVSLKDVKEASENLFNKPTTTFVLKPEE